MLKRYLLIGLVIMLSLLITVEQGYAGYSLSENITYYYGFSALSISDFSLRLPEVDEYKSFSQKAQQKLIDLANRYGDKGNIDYNFELQQPDKPLSVSGTTSDKDTDLSKVSFTPIPEVKINANYDEEELEQQTRIKTNFNLNYQMNNKTMIRAGYGLSTQKGWNLNSDRLETVPDDNDQDSNDDITNNPNEDNDSKDDETLFENEMNQESSVGISYQTSDNLTVSADYIHNKEFKGTEGKSTVFGVEYTDDEGQLKAQYQINTSEDKKQTITGLELDLKDLATITASYKLLDPQYIKNKLDKESVWDFGLDISLSEVSTFSIGYQLIDNKMTEEQLRDELGDKESNINASFKINF